MHSEFEFLGPLIGELSWQAGVWGLVCGVAGFLLALLLCWGIHRLRWLRRSPRPWNILAKLSYLLIGLVFVLLGAAGGTLYGTQRVVNQYLAQYLQPAVACPGCAWRWQIIWSRWPEAA